MLSFLGLVLMALTTLQFLALLSSILFIVFALRALYQNRLIKPINLSIQLNSMRLHHASTLYKNLVRIYLRQLFQPAELGKRLILAVCAILPVIIIPIVSASVIFDNFLWIRWKWDEQSLFFLSFTISILVYLVAELQVELKSKFLQQHRFMRLQGISQC